MLPELQRYKDTVRCASLGTEVPGHRHKQLTQTLIVSLLKTHFFTFLSLIVKSQQNRIELMIKPGKGQATHVTDMGSQLLVEGVYVRVQVALGQKCWDPMG